MQVEGQISELPKYKHPFITVTVKYRRAGERVQVGNTTQTAQSIRPMLKIAVQTRLSVKEKMPKESAVRY